MRVNIIPDMYALLFKPKRIGTARGMDRKDLVGTKLMSVDDNHEMGIVSEVLTDRARLNGREEYVCYWAIDSGFYDAIKLTKTGVAA
jgi:enoyl-CoA hydratase/carnithine racemase